MNIQVYWDGNSGAIEYNSDRLNLVSKPNINSVNFDVIAYSEDDNMQTKVYQNKTAELTPEEITTIQAFAKVNAKPASTLESLVEQHNVAPDAHHDIRVQLSEHAEAIHQVATVWTTEKVVTGTSIVPWDFSVFDVRDCSLSTDPTVWVSPANEAYDVTVVVGLSRSPTSASTPFRVRLIKNGVETLYNARMSLLGAYQTFGKQNVVLAQGDKLSVEIEVPEESMLCPFRTFLVVDNHGRNLAMKTAKGFSNTLGKILSYEGVQIIAAKDNGKPSIIADALEGGIV